MNHFKAIATLLVFSLFSCINAQTCYEIIEDASGLNTSSHIQELNGASCIVLDSIPTKFRSSFGIQHFGFYRISDNFRGGSEDVWNEVVSSVEDLKPYYILFGEEINSIDGTVQGRVSLKIPVDDEFSCITDEMMDGLESEMKMILNQESKDFYLKEIEALAAFNAFLTRSKNCCYGGNKSIINIDPELLEIQVCIGDCGNQYAVENDVALISDNNMPEIGIRLYYPIDLAMFCTADMLSINVRIEYQKRTDVIERDRSDNFNTFITNVGLNDYRNVDWGDRTEYDVEWETKQGGRVSVDVKHTPQSIETIKTFNFTIKGENPTIGDVNDFIDDNYPNVWFLKKLALVESGTFGQAITDPILQFLPLNQGLEDLHLDWEQNSRCPRTNRPQDPNDYGDGGFGMMQLTDPIPPSQALWDWKCNLAGAYSVLYLKRQSIKNSFLNLYNPILKDWVEENPTDKPLVNMSYGGYTWKMGASEVYGSDADLQFEDGVLDEYFSETLAEGEKSLLDAWLIQKYNCQSCNFLIFGESEDNGKPTFVVNFVNTTNGNDHVLSVLERVVPGVN